MTHGELVYCDRFGILINRKFCVVKKENDDIDGYLLYDKKKSIFSAFIHTKDISEIA